MDPRQIVFSTARMHTDQPRAFKEHQQQQQQQVVGVAEGGTAA